MPQIRIDKYLSDLGYSRKEARIMIKNGRVRADSAVVTASDLKIDPSIHCVFIDGEASVHEEYIYYMLNKPAGILSASQDKNRETVVDLIKEDCSRKGLFPVGRLDKDTEGLIIITNDGGYAHRVLSPKSMIPKVYEVVLDGEITDKTVSLFKEGVVLADGTPCMPARLEISDENPFKATVTIFEGKYHQIKRMFGVAELGVNYLKRCKIGSLALDEYLNPGDYKKLTLNEKELVFRG